MQTTPIRPITLSLREITFRREMLGWIGATHFMLDPLTDETDGLFAALRCTDTVRLRGGAVVPSPVFLVAPPGYFVPSYRSPSTSSSLTAWTWSSPTMRHCLPSSPSGTPSNDQR